jgi:NADPH:quinone reductase-like Zn-dependent oxidoreductase
MKAIFLIKNGRPANAFETREVAKPSPGPGQVLVKVETFGLNFADVMARNGMYKEAPPLPCVLGYDVAGKLESVGKDVTDLKPGDRVTAITRFGGYAEWAVTDARAAARISDGLDAGQATALATQFTTAYFAAAEMVNLHEGDKVLIQSGAGGVGTALVQYARYKGCEIFATAGSDEKLKYLAGQGVHHCINYRSTEFEKVIKQQTAGKGVDVIFDAVGGSSVKKGFRSLSAGGRIVCFGAAGMNDQHLPGKLRSVLGFGLYHPLMFMMSSRSMIGINMLRVGDEHPLVLKRCLQAVVELASAGVFRPGVAKLFAASEIAKAHEYLEKRQSTGKVAVSW